MDEGVSWVLPIAAVYAIAVTILILWVSTVPEPPSEVGKHPLIGRLHKPPGKPLSGFAEARGLPR